MVQFRNTTKTLGTFSFPDVSRFQMISFSFLHWIITTNLDFLQCISRFGRWRPRIGLSIGCRAQSQSLPLLQVVTPSKSWIICRNQHINRTQTAINHKLTSCPEGKQKEKPKPDSEQSNLIFWTKKVWKYLLWSQDLLLEKSSSASKSWKRDPQDFLKASHSEIKYRKCKSTS